MADNAMEGISSPDIHREPAGLKAADLFLRALEYRIQKFASTETILDGEMTLATRLRLVVKRPTDG
jgi:hypothetical protein